MVMFQYAYVSTATARQVLSMPDVDNALLVGLKPGVARKAVADRIAGLSPRLSVRDTAAMAATNQRVITDSFLPVIAVLLAIGFAVGVAVIGLTIYSAVLEKRREYGVLKALGARPGQLTSAVVVQALLAAAIWVPAFVSDIEVTDVAWVAAAMIAMAGIASAIPLAQPYTSPGV